MAGRKMIASNQVRGFRLVKRITLTGDNQQETVDLPRGPHIESVLLRFGGTMDGADAGTLKSAYRLLRRVDWLLNGNVTLDSVSGVQIGLHNAITQKAMVDASIPAVTASGAPVLDLWLDRILLDGVRPKDSYLKTDVGVSQNQLRLQFGAVADLYGTPAGASLAGVTCEVVVVDYQEARDQAGNTPAANYFLKRTGKTESVASGNGQQIKINTGNRLRYIGISSTVALDAVRLIRAGDTRLDIPGGVLESVNDRSYPALATFAADMNGGETYTHQYVIDMATVGAASGVPYSEFWPIANAADTFLVVDTSGAGSLDITTLEGVDY